MASNIKYVHNLDVRKLDDSENPSDYQTGPIVEISEMKKFSIRGFGLKAVWENIKLIIQRH